MTTYNSLRRAQVGNMLNLYFIDYTVDANGLIQYLPF